MNVLGKLANMKAELIEAFFDKYEVVAIRLWSSRYKEIKNDFKKHGMPKGEIAEIWGIPVIIDDTVPNDVAFLIAEKRGVEK